jgi:YD repeat-containing protein
MKRLIVFIAAALLLIPAAFAQEQETQKMDKRNLVIKEWNTDAKGNHKVLDHVTTYNAAGKKLEEIEYTTDGQKWRKRFEYDAEGKVSRELVYDHRNRLQTYKKFEFNELGKKKIQYTYNAKGKLIGIKQYEYIAQ